jgi:hypothetical protein
MSTTGTKLPADESQAAEAPWDDVGFNDIVNIEACDSTNSDSDWFPAAGSTYVLYAYNFDFSAVPDDATINGVECVVTACGYNGDEVIDLAQLLDEDGVRGGTNLASPSITLPKTTPDAVTLGDSSELWGLALDPTWVKDSSFGVAVGFSATTYNRRVSIDCITLEVFYTGTGGGGSTVASTRLVDCRSSRPIQRRPASRG